MFSYVSHKKQGGVGHLGEMLLCKFYVLNNYYLIIL